MKKSELTRAKLITAVSNLLNKGQKICLVKIEKILKNIKGISFTKFQSKDVVRHPLVQKIVDAYEKYSND